MKKKYCLLRNLIGKNSYLHKVDLGKRKPLKSFPWKQPAAFRLKNIRPTLNTFCFHHGIFPARQWVLGLQWKVELREDSSSFLRGSSFIQSTGETMENILHSTPDIFSLCCWVRSWLPAPAHVERVLLFLLRSSEPWDATKMFQFLSMKTLDGSPPEGDQHCILWLLVLSSQPQNALTGSFLIGKKSLRHFRCLNLDWKCFKETLGDFCCL